MQNLERFVNVLDRTDLKYLRMILTTIFFSKNYNDILQKFRNKAYAIGLFNAERCSVCRDKEQAICIVFARTAACLHCASAKDHQGCSLPRRWPPEIGSSGTLRRRFEKGQLTAISHAVDQNDVISGEAMLIWIETIHHHVQNPEDFFASTSNRKMALSVIATRMGSLQSRQSQQATTPSKITAADPSLPSAASRLSLQEATPLISTPFIEIADDAAGITSNPTDTANESTEAMSKSTHGEKMQSRWKRYEMDEDTAEFLEMLVVKLRKEPQRESALLEQDFMDRISSYMDRISSDVARITSNLEQNSGETAQVTNKIDRLFSEVDQNSNKLERITSKMSRILREMDRVSSEVQIVKARQDAAATLKRPHHVLDASTLPASGDAPIRKRIRVFYVKEENDESEGDILAS